jgi:hypothetical protein
VGRLSSGSDGASWWYRSALCSGHSTSLMPSASRAPFTLATMASTRISWPLYDGHIHISGAT